MTAENLYGERWGMVGWGQRLGQSTRKGETRAVGLFPG